MTHFTKELVEVILRNAHNLGKGLVNSGWTMQGLGMLRLYLPNDSRLHVWSPDHAFPNISTMHDHPWAFNSRVVAGIVKNQRYYEVPVENEAGKFYRFQTIKCGPGGCAMGDPGLIHLAEAPQEFFCANECYYQNADEIHKSEPEPGTVTIVKRIFKGDRDLARVFWKDGEKWVSAEPRAATWEEIEDITKLALSKWF